MKNNMIRTRFLAFLSLVVILAISCAVNPVTGKKEFMLLSESQEKAMGLSYDPEVIKEFGLYQDEKLQSFINQRGQEMVAISHRPNLGFEFRILDSPVVNAFAVPGGYVYFTRGIMAHFNNEAEFAGVLGHEIGHITARHTAKQYSASILAQLGLIVGMVVSEEFRNYSDLASVGLQLLFMKFSRDHESESDKLGVQYSTKVGYNSLEMADFFNTLARLSEKSGQSIPTFMSTHPDPGDRNMRVRELTMKEHSKLNVAELKVNRDSYLQMIEGIVYGDDPRQGYVENSAFYHPEMKFQFPIPRGWKTANSAAQVQIAPEDGKALIVLSLAEGNSLSAAQQQAITQDSLKVISSRNLNVNGNQAIEMVADLNAKVRLMMYFIQYNGLIYKFAGLSETPNFNNYSNIFESTFRSFRELTDPAKLSVVPKRVRIKTVPSNSTLAETFSYFKVAPDQMEEMAILNGMLLSDQVERGSLIKVIEK
jgi:predicted Zn-dependent protease